MTLSYNEQVETFSPSQAGFSYSTQKSVRTYLLTPSSPQELVDCIYDLIGGTTVTVAGEGNGCVNRTNPKSDPVFTWLYAANISQFRGVGKPTQTNALGPLELGTITSFAYYPQYWITVEFLPRPYAVFSDEEIKSVRTIYYPAGDNGVAAPLNYTYVNEFDRYCTFTLTPQFEAVNFTQGTMTYRSSTNPPNGLTFPYKSYLKLPNQYLKVFWEGVPYRYIYSENSNIAYGPWQFCVNQQPFSTPVGIFPAGSLLYLGYNASPYTPPVRTEVQGANGVTSTQRLCNIEFTFLYTNRTAVNPPAAPANRNIILNGHNAQPYPPLNAFYYASTTQAAAANQKPIFYSMPVHVLFTDPDIPKQFV